MSPDFIACIRMVLPLLLFIPFFKKNSLSLEDKVKFFCIGAIQYGLMYLFCIRAYNYLPAYQVVLFTACTPIYITLINDLFTKSFRPMFLLAAAIAVTGGATIYFKSFAWSEVSHGFLLVQLSDLCFAFGLVAYKHLIKKQKETKDKDLYALLFFGAFVITAISTTLFQGWGSFALLTLKQASLLVYLGLIASGICFFLWNKASTSVNAGTLAVFNNLKIPLGILVSLLIFQEKANIPNLLLSSSLILSGLLLTEGYEKLSLKKLSAQNT